jgi:hypothetical protein
MVWEGFNDDKYMDVYLSNVFSISLYRTNQNMIDIGLSLLSSLIGHFLSSKIGFFFVHCKF